MSTIADIRVRRQKLADVLDSEEYSGIRLIVEELYPDQAHFLFELLQNAQDTGATEATFDLTANMLTFEHDGRPFNEGDIEGITNIGKGTKAGDEDTIGRFGVGFKAVFAYCETPMIYSPTYSFRIESLVLPSEIEPFPGLGEHTRFEFPFNNPKKPADAAYEEIADGLKALSDTSLLFLTSLEAVSWRIERGGHGEVMRVRHSDNHLEILEQRNGKATSSSHFLRFDQPIEGLSAQSVSVAYPLRFLAEQTSFDVKKPLAKQMRLVPAEIGQVSVYFPAEKETSNLRFHLNAPFVPELSRASVKETPANEPLFDQLARLCAASLHHIRDLGLLNSETLGILPNKQDAIPRRYEGIRTEILKALNREPLTPTYGRSHAPARELFQSKAALKEVITDDDLAVLLGKEEQPRWAASAPQKNSNADRMLSSLAIRDWDVGDLIDVLDEIEADYSWQTSRPEIGEWLAAKPVEWLQRLYAMFHRELSEESGFHELRGCPIVRLIDGSFSTGEGSYFLSDGDGDGDNSDFPRVDPAVYQSGKSKPQQIQARQLLEEIGVKVVDEKELVKTILAERYSKTSIAPEPSDLRRFMKLVENDPSAAEIFANAHIFEIADGRWARPKSVFLDSPFVETGLSAYYGDQCKVEPYPLASRYAEEHRSKGRFVKFALVLGAVTKITPSKKSVDGHPSADSLKADWFRYGVRRTNSGINDDWYLAGLQLALAKKSIECAKVIWRTMNLASSTVLRARFRPNQQYTLRTAPSSLVLSLRKAKWVPQTGGEFVTPRDASRDLLPPGFPYDAGQEWLKAIEFGTVADKRTEEARKRKTVAAELGFEDDTALADAQWFAGLSVEQRQSYRDQLEHEASMELPNHQPTNPERRAAKVRDRAAEDPDKESEIRERSVQTGTSETREKADEYLRRQYTNVDGEMICQACREPLPFTLDDGSYYFERVELVRSLPKRHHQNYLALCPNHGAMYRHAHATKDIVVDLLKDCEGGDLEVTLAGQDATIYFTQTHLCDVKAILSVGQGEE